MAHYLKYGKSEVRVNLPEKQIKFVIDPNKVELCSDTPENIINRALDNPIGAGKIEDIVSPGEKICIVICDTTRSWQNPGLTLKILLSRLRSSGIDDGSITIISASGTHRRQSPDELRALVTDEIFDRIKVIDHDCNDESNLTYLGTTTRGTPVRLNSVAVASDRVILIGSVLHHFLAGFSGGAKSVLPGIAAKKTVQINHALSLNKEPGSGINPLVRSGNIDGNPVHEDMLDAADMLNPCFIINTVTDDDYNIIEAFAGDMVQVHAKACEIVDNINCVSIPGRCSAVIASAGGYPKDINVYQPLKTLCHILECIKPGGVMIMLSESHEGFGSAETEKQITGYDNMPDREKALRADYSIGAHTGFLYADCAEKYKFIYVTELDADNFEKTKMHIVHSLDDALQLATKLCGGKFNSDVCLLPYGSVTLPKAEQ